MRTARRLTAIGLAAGTLALGLAGAAPAFASVPAGNVPSDVRDFPYCELIPDVVSDGVTTEHVFNTLGFNTCPASTWDTITEQNVIDAYNAQYGSTGQATSASLNGRRFWVMDTIKSDGGNSSSPDTLTVNGMELGLKALIPLPAGTAAVGSKLYSPNTIDRSTTYVFKAHRKVYELIDPQGNVYVMQSYTDLVVPLTIKKLDNIKPLLKLPKGWDYRVRRLKKDLTLTAAGQTQVVNDQLYNTYQINPAAKIKK